MMSQCWYPRAAVPSHSSASATQEQTEEIPLRQLYTANTAIFPIMRPALPSTTLSLFRPVAGEITLIREPYT